MTCYAAGRQGQCPLERHSPFASGGGLSVSGNLSPRKLQHHAVCHCFHEQCTEARIPANLGNASRGRLSSEALLMSHKLCDRSGVGGASTPSGSGRSSMGVVRGSRSRCSLDPRLFSCSPSGWADRDAGSDSGGSGCEMEIAQQRLVRNWKPPPTPLVTSDSGASRPYTAKRTGSPNANAFSDSWSQTYG